MRAGLIMILGASLVLAPRAASGQVLLHTDQGLLFDAIVRGVGQTVTTTNVTNRGQVTLSGAGKVTVTFGLPGMLVPLSGVPGAPGLPITFGAADGQLAEKNKTTPFDPRLGTSVNLSAPHGVATIYIGGAVQSNLAQPAGTYAGSITVTVAP